MITESLGENMMSLIFFFVHSIQIIYPLPKKNKNKTKQANKQTHTSNTEKHKFYQHIMY